MILLNFDLQSVERFVEENPVVDRLVSREHVEMAEKDGERKRAALLLVRRDSLMSYVVVDLSLYSRTAAAVASDDRDDDGGFQ